MSELPFARWAATFVLLQNKPLPRFLLAAWLAFLLVATVTVPLLAKETEVNVGKQGDHIWAEIEGTRLDVPAAALGAEQPAQLALPSLKQLRLDPPSSSLYWQPAQDNTFYVVGLLGEWLQGLRPAAEWTAAQITGTDTGTYKLRGGRSLALLPIERDGTGDGLVLLVRPERANFVWWTLEGGRPGHELAHASYRPSGFVSLGDVGSEIVSVGWAASILGALAWLVGYGLSLRQRGLAALVRAEAEPSEPIWRRKFIGRGARPSKLAIVFFAAGTAVAATACLFVLDGIPHVQDEVAYIFQAKIFAHLQSWAPAPISPEFFDSGFIETFQGRWFAKYPPGYPLMLAGAVWAGVPWLTNVLSSGAALALIYAAGLRMFGRQVAIWAALLGLLSPWVIFMSGSYMSHPTTMFWAALFLYSLVRLRQANMGSTPRAASRWGLIAGLAIGMAFITREWTALGIGLGAAVWGMGDIVSAGKAAAGKLVPYIFVVVGFVPPLLFMLYENHELTGDWLRLAQDLVGSYDTPGFGPGHGSEIGHTPAMGVYNGLVYLRTLAMVFNGWPAPFSLAPVLLGLAACVGGGRKQLAWDLLLWLLLAGLVGAYFAWWSSTTIFGPRYWYEGMPFLLLIAGRGMDLLGREAARSLERAWALRARWLVPAGLLAIFSVYTVTQTLPLQIAAYTDYNNVSTQPLAEVQRAGLTNALVFVAIDPKQRNRDFGKVAFANDPFLEGSVIYVRDMGLEANTFFAGRYNGRKAYWLPLQGPPKEGFGP